MSHVCLVEDDRAFAWLVKVYLERRGHQVDVAHSAYTGWRMIQETRPQAVVLDIVMPERDGLQLCRDLRAHPELGSVPILFLTARGAIEEKVAGFQAGGDDYVTKPVQLRELDARLGALVARGGLASPRQPSLQVGDLELQSEPRLIRVKGRPVALTQVEYELLEYLMRHAQRPFSSRQLLREVWGYPPGMGEQALVRGYIRRLRGKIEPHPQRPSYLLTWGRQGYVLQGSPE